MKDGKKIVIKNPLLLNLRMNLRKILSVAITEESRRISNLEDLYFKNRDIDQNTPSQMKRMRYLQEKKNTLSKTKHHSILLCSGGLHKGSSIDKNKVYDASQNQWYCEKCYERLLWYRANSRWFNDEIIVNKEAIKPCEKLRWCPYGYMVEQFSLKKRGDYPCPIFSHDCPVYYISEQITEDSPNIPPRNKKLTADLKELFFKKDDLKKRGNFPKPCSFLKWCPYGHVATVYPESNGLSKYNCKLFNHDCPVYHVGLIL